jgi:glycosyltransferase involved in cell wall biosynthesis
VPEVRTNLEPPVTVCVPTIGRTVTLRATLDSLKAQTYSNYEVLLLDNASPPDTQEEISRYVRTEVRASVLRSAVQLPMFDNFQRGVDAASGRYLAFFHDDDLYAKDFLTEQVRLLEENPSIGFVGSNWKIIDADGHPVGNRNLIRSTEVWSGWRYIEALFALGSNLLPMPGLVFRRDVLHDDTFGSAKGAHFSDFVILMRIAEDHDVGLCARQLITLRSHRDQTSLQLGIGESLRLRTATFTEYCDDLVSRRPERAGYVKRLRRSIRSARRSSAVWTWLQADDKNAAEASRAALGSKGMDWWLRHALQVADRIGVGGLLRTRRVQRRIKNAAYFVVNRTR